MPVTEIHVPRLGEGVMEARLVRFFRQPGERIQRDEPLLEVETDKAVYVMEAPEEGVVGDWKASEGDVLPIGALVVTIRSDDAESDAPAARQAQRNGDLSPRVRAWCREHEITEETISAVRALHGTRP